MRLRNKSISYRRLHTKVRHSEMLLNVVYAISDSNVSFKWLSVLYTWGQSIMKCFLLFTAVRRHCTDWYEIWALTDHEIYYIKIELDLRKFSNGPFSETEKAFWVNPTPGGSQCTGLSPTLSWKWPRATLSPSFGPFFERNRFFEVFPVSQFVPKWLRICPWEPSTIIKRQNEFVLLF